MTDDLTPPHWGSQEMPTQQMTGDEINALVERLETMGDVPVSAILDAITTLRAQLAAETDRANRAEAERAAQIEADAGIADHYANQDYCAMGYPEEGGIAASGTADMIRREIRAQPHDRTALEAATRAAKVEAWRLAASVAANACLVEPDGGSPTEEERLVCDEACRRIMALIGEATK